MTIDIDFLAPRWLTNYYDIIGFASLFLNSFGIYLLIFECKKIGRFRYYLLGFQMVCTLTDVHLNFLTQQIPLAPFFAMFTVGTLSTFFNVSAHICATIFAVLTLIQLESLLFCMGKKHQAIAEILKIHIFPKFILYSCYALCLIGPFVLCAALQWLHIPQREQLAYIEQNHHNLLPGFSSLKYFVIYIKTPNTNWFFVLLLIGGTGFSMLFLFFITDLFKLMTDLKLKLSRATYQKHKTALQSLTVQFFTSILCLGPPVVLVVITFLEIQNTQTISKFSIAWFTSHSSTNMLALCFIFPPYRKFFVKHADKNRKRIQAAASSVLF